MATTTKATTKKNVLALADASTQRTLAQELSDVLGVVRHHATLFPDLVDRTRIALILKSGERLELELSGRIDTSSSLEEYGHVCLGHDFEISGLRSFFSIEDLGLGATAKAAAQSLLNQFPLDVKFTSGKRSIERQAAAMAPNVLKNRKWIQQTYKDTPERAALQKWVDDNPSATTAEKISVGLMGVMNSWNETQQRNFSRHITGDAFDIQPVAGTQGDKIKQAIAKLPKLNWHTFEEGGLEIWHAQFDV